jgi:glycerate dehydrogenase
MQIVLLDGYTNNPGDLSWADLKSLGPCAIYERTPPAEIVARSAPAEIVLTNKTALSRETIAQLPRLRYIGVLATGYDIVDAAAARERNIPVCNVPSYASRSVAQMVFAHLLNLTLHVADHGHGVADGRWTRSADFCYWDFPLVELADLTMGLVGFGRIGRATADVALAMGMNVIAYDKVTGDCRNFRASENGTVPFGVAAPNVRFVELDELFRQSDVVSLHCPLTPETQRLVNADRLAMMKPSAYLINTSRGPLIDEQALADALHAGQIAGAGIDVLSSEPPPADHPLLGAPNCCITPHIAWATRAARARLLDVTVQNIRAFLAGKPQNVVNP